MIRKSIKFGPLTVAIMAFGLFAAAAPVAGQAKKPNTPAPAAAVDRKAQSTPAYSEILLRETELRADVEALLTDYTDEFPKVKESRYALELIGKEKARLLLSFDPDKLTLALGKIVVRKVDAELELWRLQQSLADAHPDVKRAKRRVEIFEAAIKEILG
jgi:hypothetical protein